jgi:nitroreductase
VILVKDAVVRRGLRDLYLTGWYEYLAQRQAGLTPWAPVTDLEAEARAIGSAGQVAAAAAAGPGGFAEHLDEVPVVLVVLVDLRVLAAVDRDLARTGLAGGASVYPFVWSLLLAARDEHLGGVMTTMVIRREAEVKLLLGVPEPYAVAALVVLGYPVREFQRLGRGPVADFTTVDRFTGPPLGGDS